MRKKILSLCMVAVLVAMQIPVLANAELNDGDVVWEESFEEKTVGYEIKNDTEYWARVEKRGTDNALVDFSATVAGSEGHKYLKIDANIADNSARAGVPTAGVVTKKMSEMGLSEDEPFTVSYDFKTSLYNANTMNGTEYYQSIYGEGNNVAGMTKGLYFYTKPASGNAVNILTDPSGKANTNLTAIFGDGVRSMPDADTLYTAGWNSIQWVVHASSESNKSYAELYVNGTYSGTVALRDGEYARCLVFGIALAKTAQSGTVYVDNIKVTKGAVAKADTAKTVVNAVTTGFEESDLANGVMPGVSQSSSNIKINNVISETLFETTGGAYGKASSDMAMHIHNTVAETATTGEESLEIFMGKSSSPKLYANGDKQEFSFDFAFDNIVNPVYISGGRMFGPAYEDNSSSYKANNIVRVEQAKIVVGATSFALKESLAINTWYNLRVVFERGTGSTPYTVYLTRADGEQEVFEGDFYSYYKNVYNGISKCLISYGYNTNKARGVWVDNFSIKSYIGGESAKAVTSSDEITLGEAEGIVKANVVVDNASNPNSVLLLAVYDVVDGKRILSDVIVDKANSSAKYCGLKCETSKTDGQVVKAMLWDGFDTVKPLLGAKEITE